jgi:type II secretory pathway pseudopilin PulG
MRVIAAVFSVLILAGAPSSAASAGEVEAIEAVDNAAAQLDEAFEAQDADAIEALTTPDHLAVTHYYREPTTVADQIASLPDLKYQQTNLTEPEVTLLGAEAAMRRFTAKLDGSYKGKPLSGRVYITQIMVMRDGKWLEKFYQVTELEP